MYLLLGEIMLSCITFYIDLGDLGNKKKKCSNLTSVDRTSLQIKLY